MHLNQKYQPQPFEQLIALFPWLLIVHTVVHPQVLLFAVRKFHHIPQQA